MVDELAVSFDHLFDEILKEALGLPSEFIGSLLGVPDEQLHLSGAKVLGVHAHENARRIGGVVSDFVDVVVHLFESSQRIYYDIEALWKNGARVEWRRPEDGEPEVAGDTTIA